MTLADDIRREREEAYLREREAAEELVRVISQPVRSDDGYYDYVQARIDKALAVWHKAVEK